MPRKSADLLLTICISAANVAWSLLPGHVSFIGLVLAIPLIFLLPGYALTESLFPPHARSTFLPKDKQLTGASRFTFTVGLSIIIDILGGFTLNLLPWGLHAVSWSILLGSLTILFAGIATYRRSQLSKEYEGQFQKNRTAARHTWPSIWEGALVCCSLIIILATLAYSINSARNQPYPGFTQFWLSNAAANEQSCSVHINVKSFESTSLKYRIIMTTNKAPLKTWSDISMTYEQLWNRAVLLPVTYGMTSIDVQAQLYREDQPGRVYRQVHATISVEKDHNDGKTVVCKKF